MPDSSSEIEPIVSDAPVVAAADSTPAPVVTAEPTPAEKPISVLDAVTKALGTDTKTGVDAGAPTAENRSSKDGTGTQDKPATGEPAPDPSEEELKQYTPNAQKRIRELVDVKNTLSSQVETVARERDTFKPKAESYDKLTGYLARHGVTSDEANNSLEVARLVKSGDYVNALKILTPIFQDVQKRAGEVLDPDLQEDVRLGHMAHERALETQRLRAVDAATRERGQREQERTAAEQTQESNRQFVATVAKAADDWAKAKAGGDPDWDKKATEVAEIVELDLRRNGFPKTPAEAIQRSEKALEQVNLRWKSLRGTPQEIKPTVGNGRSSTRNIDPPKSALEAINRVLS